MELFSKLFPGSDFGKPDAQGFWPLLQQFLPFLTHTVLNPQAHVLIEEGRVGASRVVPSPVSPMHLKFWGRACGNAGWMTSKKEYDETPSNLTLGLWNFLLASKILETSQNKGSEFHVFTCGEKWYPTKRCAPGHTFSWGTTLPLKPENPGPDQKSSE